MLAHAVPSALITTPLSREELQAFADSLCLHDRVLVVFREPSSPSPTQVKWWRGVVVPNCSRSSSDRPAEGSQEKWIAFDDAPPGLIVPFPLSVSSPPVEFLAARRSTDVVSLEAFPAASPARQRHGSQSLGHHVDPSSFPRQGSQNALDSPGSFLMSHSNSSLLLTAMTGRLYPTRTIVVFVCMPEFQGSQDLLADSNLTVADFKSPLAALDFISKNFDKLAAVVTSSCKNEFEREGISGVDLCNEVLKRRGGVGVSPPFAMMVTKSLAMHDSVQSCDIFVHPPTHSDGANIAIKELLRRLVPPSVVWVVQNVGFVTENMKNRISALGFSLRIFDSTLVAYEFISTCPWNIAAVVTSPLTDLVHKRDLSGIELAARLKNRQVCRFVAPHLILLHRPSDVLSSQSSDLFNELVENSGEEEKTIERLVQSLARVKNAVDGAEFPGAVIFGRACYISLSNTFPSSFSAAIGDEVFDFPNVEQFFQAVKHFGSREEFDAIRKNPSVHGALQRSWSLKIRSREWNSVRDDVMRFALYQKFRIPGFRDALLATGTREIIQTTPDHDLYWGDGNQEGGGGHGRNRLGEMLMETRQNLRRNANFDFPFPHARLAAVLHQAERIGDTRSFSGSNNVFVIDFHDVLGKGGFGKVYKAHDTFTAQAVAVKVMEVREGVSTSDLRREFDMLALIDDPNVVKVLNAEFDDQVAKIYMEFMSGGSVDSIVKTRRLYEPSIRHHIQQILQGLNTLHTKYKIVHCDIKPQNFLLDGHVCKLSDFGSCTLASNQMETAGTMLYMSPTRLAHNIGSFADDIWAIGCSVVRMALGGNLQPWMREDEDPRGLGIPQLLFRAHQPPHHPAIPARLSHKAQAFVLRCFTRDPEFRPSASELLNDPWFFDPVEGVEPVDEYMKDINICDADREHFTRNFQYIPGGTGTNCVTYSRIGSN